MMVKVLPHKSSTLMRRIAVINITNVRFLPADSNDGDDGDGDDDDDDRSWWC